MLWPLGVRGSTDLVATVEDKDVPLTQGLLQRRRLWTGLRLFAALSVAGLLAVTLYTGAEESLPALGRIRWLHVVLALGFATADWLATGLRLYLFARRLHPAIRYWTCAQAGLSNTFMGAVTPSQTGGGFAQVYVLARAGMPVTSAIMASLASFTCTVIAIGALTTGALATLEPEVLELPGVRYWLSYAALAFGIVAVFTALCMLHATAAERLAQGLLGWVVRLRGHTRESPPAWARRASAWLSGCQKDLAGYTRTAKGTIAAGAGLSAFSFLAKYMIAYVILLGLSAPVPLEQVILVQILITFAAYFLPTPGGSGLMEVVAATLMGLIAPVDVIPVFTVLWRFATSYVNVALGGLVLLRVLKVEGA